MTEVKADERIRLGGTNLQVSRICFGTSALGDMAQTYGYGVDEARAHDTVRAVFDGPINFLDASRNYGFGRSEARVGDVVRERGGLPEGFVISTKLDRDTETGAFDASVARRSLEQSLEALGLDRVQLLHLHDPEHARSVEEITGPGGALPELFKMKEEGLADAIGLAAGRTDVMMPIMREWDFDAIITHNRFTLVNRHAEPMIDLAIERGMAVLNAAPYAGGALAKGSASGARYVYQKATDAMLEPVRQVEAICAQYDVPVGAAALQFSMRDPRITSTICGVSKPERVAETIAWANYPIPEAMWQELKALTFSTVDPEATRRYTLG